MNNMAKKRGRPKGSKNKVKTTVKKKAEGLTSERFEMIHLIEDLFYSETLTAPARTKFTSKYPGEENYFNKEWKKVAGDVANIMIGK
tara:strand:- start:840 stop:1100 length:261 start_codon:yes stop_codon:yes gene_type:complete